MASRKNIVGRQCSFQNPATSTATDLSRAVRLHDSTVLHFSCHGHTSALSLFGQDLAAQDLVKFIESWCASGKRLQFIIANAYHSAEIVHTLSNHVDFVIGHSTHVLDADVVNFARELYGHLGAGDSLELSFNAAKCVLVSNPYCLLRRKNARLSRLLPPGVSETASVAVGSSILASISVMIVLLLFLQKENLALAVYLFGSVLSLPD